MLRSLLSAIDDALDTLYEPNAVFSQLLGSASITFFFLSSFPCFLFLSCLFLLFLSFLFFSCFSCLFFSFLFLSFLFFSFLSFFVFSFSCLFFPFLHLFFSLLVFPIDLRMSCVCVVIDTTCNIYIRGSLSWVASGVVGFSRRE